MPSVRHGAPRPELDPYEKDPTYYLLMAVTGLAWVLLLWMFTPWFPLNWLGYP